MPRPPPQLPRIAAAGRYRGDATVFMHAHPHAELLLIESGRSRIEVPQCAFACSAGAGSLLILPARADHRHVGVGAMETAWILLSDRACNLDDTARVLPLPPGDPALGWFAAAVSLHVAGDQAGVAPLLAAVLERASMHQGRAAAASACHPAVARAQRLIEADPARPWTLAALARGSGVGGAHLAALFGVAVGCTPLRYHTRIRLAAAQRLLADPYRPVHAVAAALGLEANYFCRLFRAHVGRSPAAWRREQGGAR